MKTYQVTYKRSADAPQESVTRDFPSMYYVRKWCKQYGVEFISAGSIIRINGRNV